MNKLKIIIGMLAFLLVILPGVVALEGESPVEIFDRLTVEMILVIASVSLFCIALGVAMIIGGSASPSIRAWGARLIVGVLLGNFLLLVAPWFLAILRPS